MNPTPQERPTSDSATLTPQIKKRIAIAGGLVLVALAAIPFIDHLNPPATTLTPATTPVSSGRIVQKQAELAPAAPDSAVTIASAAITATAPRMASSSHATPPGAPLTPKTDSPAAVNSLDKVTKPATPPLPPLVNRQVPKPASDAPNSNKPPAVVQPTAIAQAPDKAGPRPALPPASNATIAPGIVTPAPAPFAVAPAIAPPPSSKAVAIAPTGRSLGYQLQLGLFSSPNNAEKLVEDLKQRGITARTETRVQLGPFRTRAEAEESMRQLRALGYQPMLIPAGQQ